jgi:hypothetical protein
MIGGLVEQGAKVRSVACMALLSFGCSQQDVPDGSGGASSSGGSSGTEKATKISFACGGTLYSGTVDVDGDGYADPMSGPWAGTAVACFVENAGREALPFPDCDDTDSAVYHTGFRDADGDGYGDVETPVCYGDASPAGVVVQIPDCDDADPSVNVWFLLDADHDGFGGSEVCAIEPMLGVVELNSGGDCADEAPAVNPDAADFPGDGADTDCDGADGVNVAAWGDSFPQFTPALDASIPDTVCADTSGLAVAALHWLDFFCQWPSGTFNPDGTARAYMAFANEGNVTTSAADAILTSDLAPEWTLAVPIPVLEPGTTTDHYSLGRIPVSWSLEFRGPADDGCGSVLLSTQRIAECQIK